jgi:hypothetical protein
MSSKYHIDESHGLEHSMNALIYANDIFQEEIKDKPQLIPHENIIYVSSVLHDMCDKKYINEEKGLAEIENYLSGKIYPYELHATKKIITTMSYSKVKKYGFPDLGEYQNAYHVVREADLLSAYDFDRSMLYHMHTQNTTIENAFINAKDLFVGRVLKHNEDGLFYTKYGMRESVKLHDQSIHRIWKWKRILNI